MAFPLLLIIFSFLTVKKVLPRPDTPNSHIPSGPHLSSLCTYKVVILHTKHTHIYIIKTHQGNIPRRRTGFSSLGMETKDSKFVRVRRILKYRGSDSIFPDLDSVLKE